MAFIRVEPVTVQVRTDWFNGRPREITWGDERLPITRLAVVREEAAAYPVISGPRTLFEVDTPRARLSLTFQHRSRRWTVTGLDEGVRTRRLIANTDSTRGNWGLCASARRHFLPTPSATSVSGRARRYRARPAPTSRRNSPPSDRGRNRTIAAVEPIGHAFPRPVRSTRSSAELGSPAPVPGGGSASAVAAGLGAALVQMVAALSRVARSTRPTPTSTPGQTTPAGAWPTSCSPGRRRRRGLRRASPQHEAAARNRRREGGPREALKAAARARERGPARCAWWRVSTWSPPPRRWPAAATSTRRATSTSRPSSARPPPVAPRPTSWSTCRRSATRNSRKP